MTITLLAIGKTDSAALQQLIEVYQQRLQHYIKFEYKLLPDIKNTKNLSVQQQKQQEGELLLKNLQKADVLVLLDEKGKQFRGFTILRNEPYHHE